MRSKDFHKIELAPCPLCTGQMKAFHTAGGISEIRCVEPHGTGTMTFRDANDPIGSAYELTIIGCGLSFKRWEPILQVIWQWNDLSMNPTIEYVRNRNRVKHRKRVKIIKAGLPSFWYAKYIGEEFTLTYGSRSHLWETDMPDKDNEIGYVDLEDCQILESESVENNDEKKKSSMA